MGETQHGYCLHRHDNPRNQVGQSGKPGGSSFTDLALASNRRSGWKGMRILSRDVHGSIDELWSQYDNQIYRSRTEQLNNLTIHQHSLAEITSTRVYPSRPVSQPKFDSHVCSGGSESIKSRPEWRGAFLSHGSWTSTFLSCHVG